jgi:hypothetical protein
MPGARGADDCTARARRAPLRGPVGVCRRRLLPVRWADGRTAVAVPKRIKIRREEGYHTDLIGTYAEGRQFMAFVTATLPSPAPRDWQAHKRWYAVLHTFDANGRHIETRSWFAGTTSDGEQRVIPLAQTKLNAFLAALGELSFGDVCIRLFSTDIDGQTFGLVDASDPDEDYESVHLLPNDLAFFDPWDGSYDT